MAHRSCGSLHSPKAKVQSVVRRHLNRLIGCSDDVRAGGKKERQNDVLAKSYCIQSVQGCSGAGRGDSPFVVLAGERCINKLSDGSCVTDIIYDNDQRQFSSAFSVNMVGQVGKIQLQLL